MIKIILLVLLFFQISLKSTNSEDEYKILYKVDKKIITNFDLQNEQKYLLALNPSLSKISKKQIIEIAEQSLIRETIKDNEILKYYKIDYNSPSLAPLIKNIYTKLNMSTEDEFTDYLLSFDLELEEITRKLAIEAAWNKLIYDKYKNLINIDESKIKEKLNDDIKNTSKQKKFLISEILFDAKNELEFNKIYKDITTTIKEKNFKTAALIYSIADTSQNGGEIGWTSKNEISIDIYKELSSLKINQYSKVLKVASGFLIINLENIKEEKIEINQEYELKKRIAAEKNRQLNQYSIVFYKKIEKGTFIDEQ